LLRGERFRDVCEVQLQDRGYVILPARKALGDASFDAHPILGDSSSKRWTLDVAPGPIPCETSHLSSQHADFDGVEFTQRFCPDEPLCLEDADKPSMKEISPATAPFPFPTPSPQYDYSGSHGGNAFTWNLACRSLRMASSTHGHHARETRSLWMHSDCGKEASAIEEPPSVPKQLFCPDEPLDLEAAHQEVSCRRHGCRPHLVVLGHPPHTTQCDPLFRIELTVRMRQLAQQLHKIHHEAHQLKADPLLC